MMIDVSKRLTKKLLSFDCILYMHTCPLVIILFRKQHIFLVEDIYK